jgi:hypothetical protein
MMMSCRQDGPCDPQGVLLHAVDNVQEDCIAEPAAVAVQHVGLDAGSLSRRKTP